MNKKFGISEERIDELALGVQTYSESDPLHPQLTVKEAIRIAATESYAKGIKKGRKEALKLQPVDGQTELDPANH